MNLSSYWVDLHLHTVLSPCAELEMGAPEIVSAYRGAGVSLCAVTDHNDIANAPAIREAAEGDPAVLTGMEIQTAEDIHVVVIFPDDESAVEYRRWLWLSLPDRENDPSIFGYQLVIDHENNIMSERDTLLVQGVGYSVDEVASEACRMGAVVIPAHLDRPSFSYESVLEGARRLPVPRPRAVARRVAPAFAEWRERYPDRVFVRSSDAHRLSEISRDRCTVMRLAAPSFDEMRMALGGMEGRSVLNPWTWSP